MKSIGKTAMRIIFGLTLLWGNSSAIFAQAPEVTGYYLTDGHTAQYASLENLQNFAKQITLQKANFNKLVLSFVEPSIYYYQSGSLAGTGLFNYFIAPNSTPKQIQQAQQDPDAQTDFQTLKSVITELHKSNIAVYIAVGGWNFSCDPTYYTESLQALGKTPPKANMCGPEDGLYDTFPNPSTSPRPPFENSATVDQAKLAYANLVKLANDLGVDGIDIDYEEFWHADLNSYSMANILNNKWQIQNKTPFTYDDFIKLMQKFATQHQLTKNADGTISGKIDIGNPGLLLDTVDKFAAIVATIHTDIVAAGKTLKISAALPAVGGMPITGLSWSQDPAQGQPWYFGNLKGLMYETAFKNETVANYIDSMSVMTYDLAKNDSPTGQGSMELTDQVAFYMNQYRNWLKNPNPSKASLENQKIYAAKYNLKAKLSFGFEVGRPAYPAYDPNSSNANSMPLTQEEMNTILAEEVSNHTDGIIMWDLFKDLRYDENYLHSWNATWSKPSDILDATCQKLKLDSDQYNCFW